MLLSAECRSPAWNSWVYSSVFSHALNGSALKVMPVTLLLLLIKRLFLVIMLATPVGLIIGFRDEGY